MADPLGRPVAFALTPGNVADIAMAIPRLETVQPPRCIIADKAYDAMRLRHTLPIGGQGMNTPAWLWLGAWR